MADSFDDNTKQAVKKIPLLSENAGPRDPKDKWDARLKQVRGGLRRRLRPCVGGAGRLHRARHMHSARAAPAAAQTGQKLPSHPAPRSAGAAGSDQVHTDE